MNMHAIGDRVSDSAIQLQHCKPVLFPNQIQKQQKMPTCLTIYNGMSTRKLIRLELGLYSMTDVSRLLYITFAQLQDAIRGGNIERPTHIMPGCAKLYYNRDDVKNMKDYFLQRRDRMKKGLLTLTATAKMLKVPYQRFTRLVHSGHLPQPTERMRLRRCYTYADIPILQQALAHLQPRPKKSIYLRLADEGLYSGVQASKRIGMPNITFQYWLRKGWFPKPARKAANAALPLYNQTDLEDLKRIREERQNIKERLKTRGHGRTISSTFN